jgi:hypothetical protein
VRIVFARAKSVKVRRANITGHGRLDEIAGNLGLPSKSELCTGIVLFLLICSARVVEIFRFRFNSDEPQHLHVIWGWTHGLVQYRDLFDNHMPLFHLIGAPLFALVGDRAIAPVVMRFVMLPLYFVTAWCIFRIGELLFSRRVGIWSVLLCSFWKGFFFCSLEFRSDIPWMTLWALFFVVLLEDGLSNRRLLAGGALLGLCFAISMKSVLLFLALVLTELLAWFLLKPRAERTNPLARIRILFPTALLFPGIIFLFFAARGVAQPFIQCVFQHNLAVQTSDSFRWPLLASFFGIIGTFYAARLIEQRSRDSSKGFLRAFVFLFCGIYLVALHSVWRFVTRQDYLPVYPLIFPFIASGLISFTEKFARRQFLPAGFLRQIPLPALICVVFLIVTFAPRSARADGARTELRLLRHILTLTKPNEYVLDWKGESIFRKRCVYYAFESLTREQMRTGAIHADIAQHCIDTHTFLAASIDRVTGPQFDFVKENYIAVGDGLRVAGRLLNLAPENKTVAFSVALPASYEIVACDLKVEGMLDGKPYNGPRFLEAGNHTFTGTCSARWLALIWSPAVAHNLKPAARKFRSG